MTDQTPWIQELGFQPVKKAPSQTTFNGIGTRLYGAEKVSNSDDLFVKNHYVVFLFIPLLVIGRYLVQQRDGKEYVLGKSALSRLAKSWNGIFLASVAGLIAWTSYQEHISSPEYIAKKQYENAVLQIEDKQFEAAMEQLKAASISYTTVAPRAKDKAKQLMTELYLDNATPEQVVAIITGARHFDFLIDEVEVKARAYFTQFASSHPWVASRLASQIVETSKDEAVIQEYGQKSYELMKSAYSEHKENFDFSTRYALLEEQYNQCTECIAILQPHESEMKNGEAARVLGQAYTVSGETERAYALLAPYVKTRIEEYRLAEKAYDDILDKVWDDSIDALNAGAASSEFYTKYDAASDEEKQQMVDEFYVQRRDRSSAVESARQRYIASTSVVPVALDLGTVLLDKALLTNDVSTQNKLLEQAEATFLSVQGAASNDDQYALYLGQVYYWLGKEQEGEKLFDQLLNKYNRGHGVLYSLSQVLRDLGADDRSKALVTEAYETATEEEDKQKYAQMLAVLSTDMEEQLAWLEKSDQTNNTIKAELLNASGDKALDDEQEDEAKEYYLKAVALYESSSEDTISYNNLALVYSKLYSITRDSKHREALLDNMDRAVALEPSDSIVLKNASFYHLRKSYADLLDDTFNYANLDALPRLQDFYFLYETETEKNQLITKLRSHSSFKKGVSYLEKAVLLAPKNETNVSELFALFRFTRNESGIEKIANRYKGVAPPNLDSQRKSIAEFRSGEFAESNLQRLERYLEWLETQKANKDLIKRPSDTVFLNAKLVDTYLSLPDYGGKTDVVKVLKLARENYRVMPSSSTRGDLEKAMMAKILADANEAVPGFASFLKKYLLIFDEEEILGLGLQVMPEFKEYVMKHQLKAPLVDLLELGEAHFPNTPGLIDWKLLAELGSDQANVVAQRYLKSEFRKNMDEYYYRNIANEEYLSYYQSLQSEMAGDVEQAKRINQEAVAKGLLLPNMY